MSKTRESITALKAAAFATAWILLSTQQLVAEEPSNPTMQNLAIVGVHVLTMEDDRVLENQTVLVVDGKIDTVGPRERVKVPEGSKRIEGEGRYLMPGLADLHVHLRRSEEYVNYLSQGVTTVMHLGGSESRGRRLLEHRREIARGDRLGPNIYATQRVLDGDPAASGGAYRISEPKVARERVVELKQAGFDFVKIYNNVPLAVFEAIIDEAQKQQLPVFGHIPRKFDPRIALRGGQNAVVHTEEFFFTLFEGPRSTENMDRDYKPDLSVVPELLEILRENSVAIMPDLSFTFTNFIMWDSLDNLWMDPEIQYQHPDTISDWRTSNINRRREIENFVVRGQWKYELMQELTRQFETAGILQVLGTDASLPGLFPGKAAHRELTELVKAGLSNFEALATGTRNAGDFVNRYIEDDSRFGRIEPGYRADLMLLESNPLEDIRNARDPIAVAVRGRWIESSEWQTEREALADRYRGIERSNEVVDSALAQDGAAQVLRQLVETHSDNEELLQSIERRINGNGYAAAFREELKLARTILEIGTQTFPESANSWDSLAEINLLLGNRNMAIEYYEKALEVDPTFSNATEQLDKIRAESPEED